MTVKDVAEKMGVSKWAIYKKIERKSGIGAKFFFKGQDGWFIYAKDAKKYLKGGEK